MMFVGTHAHADDPSEDEDPKVAIQERGTVLKAGKRHFFVIVPAAVRDPADPADSTIGKSTKIYFGDARALENYGTYSWTGSLGGGEERGLADSRGLYDTAMKRFGDQYELICAPQWDGAAKKIRKIPLKAATASGVARAVVRAAPQPRVAEYLARFPGTTMYLYVDKLDDREHRLFMGKRGAMKALPIKEMVDDTSSTVFVTAKGTLTIVGGRSHTRMPTMTFGSAKKPTALEPLAPPANRKLIYFDLGIYTRERSGHPCDEL